MTAEGLRVGLLAESTEQLNAYRRLLQQHRCRVVSALLAAEVEANPAALSDAVDVWLVTVAQEHPAYASVERWLATVAVPLIVDDGEQAHAGHPDYAGWGRRLMEKLLLLRGQLNLEQGSDDVAANVWVLAASTGGPAAVREFFAALPDSLPVGFIYVQHIDPGHDGPLIDMLNKSGHYPGYRAQHGDIIRTARTALVTGQQWMDCHANGTLCARGEPWPGPYSPSVDQVLSGLARGFGRRSGAIIFSGMGDDGAIGSRLIRQCGGQVWAQAPESCTVSAMPEAVIATGVVSCVASPAQLAQQLAAHLRNNNLRNDNLGINNPSRLREDYGKRS